MTQGSLLERTLAANLAWNKARIKFLAAFLVALTQTRSVNLMRIAAVFGGRAASASSYKRIQRFLRHFDLPLTEMAHLLIRLMKLQPPFVVVIDRTEWKFGCLWHNILTLSLANQDIAVPILWKFLKRKGCSFDAEREEIMVDFLKMFPATEIQYVCADREFASRAWLEFLTREQISYRLRYPCQSRIDGQTRQSHESAKIIADGTHWRSRNLPAMAKVMGSVSSLRDRQETGRRRVVALNQQ